MPFSTFDHNALLRRFEPTERERFLRAAKLVELRQGQIAFREGAALDMAYFPVGLTLSIHCGMSDGSRIEIESIGREGAFGAEIAATAIARPLAAPWPVEVSRAGWAWTLPMSALRDIISGSEARILDAALYAQARREAMARSACCSRLHSTEQQLARRLLSESERADSARIHCTQESIAFALGIRRETASVALGKLQEIRALRLGRGWIELDDLPQLEFRSCECRKKIAEAFERFNLSGRL